MSMADELRSRARDWSRSPGDIRADLDEAADRIAALEAALEECAVWMFTREKVGAGPRICDRAADVLARTTPPPLVK